MTSRGALEAPGSTFWIVWIGQFVSIVGSGLTLYGIPIWVFLETRSITQLALLLLVASLARVAAMPLVGILVDRWDRRRAMMLSDAGAGLGTLAIALLLVFDALQVWHLYPALAFSGFFGALQFPAYSAAVTQLVPKAQLGRAAGLAELSDSVARVVGPFLAGALLAWSGLGAVVLVDVVTFLVALTTLAAVRFPTVLRSDEVEAASGSLLSEARFGLSYLRARRGLLALVLFIGAIALLMSFVNVLIFPLILSFATEAEFGAAMSVAALALVASSLVMSSWGGPRTRMHGVLGFMLLVAGGLVIVGLRPNLVPVTLGVMIVYFQVPLINGSSQALFQTKVEPGVQGRVFAIRRLVGEGAAPLGLLLAGPLADRVFEPLLAVDGALAGSVGVVLGTGPGRGVGLVFVVVGVLTAAVTAAGYAYRPLRELDSNVPDAVPDAPLAA